MPNFRVNNYGKFIKIETADKPIVVYCTDEQLRDLYKQLDAIYNPADVNVQIPQKVLGTIELTIENDQVVSVELKGGERK